MRTQHLLPAYASDQPKQAGNQTHQVIPAPRACEAAQADVVVERLEDAVPPGPDVLCGGGGKEKGGGA